MNLYQITAQEIQDEQDRNLVMGFAMIWEKIRGLESRGFFKESEPKVWTKVENIAKPPQTKEERNIVRKIHYQKHREEILAKQKAYKKLKYYTDPEFRAKRIAYTKAYKARRRALKAVIWQSHGES